MTAHRGSIFRALRKPPVITTVSILALYVAAHPRVHARLDSTLSDVILSLQQQRLNRQDRALLERGYYEDLLGVDRTNPELWNLYEQRPAAWRSLWQTNAMRWTGNILRLELVPLVRLDNYKGAALTINRWGMRDRDYELKKPARTFRFAMLGASPVMGSGVNDDETFEARAEERLNREAAGTAYAHYEILNFAVEGYTTLQQVMTLETKVFAFHPDALIFMAHETEADKTIGDIAGLLETDTEIPYPELVEIIHRAGAKSGTKRSIAMRHLGPHADDILTWAYRRIVADCREQGVQPIWVFMPMPATDVVGPAAAADRNDPRVVKLFRLASEAGFTVLDLSGVYDGHPLPTLWVATWDRHPNAAAHRLIGDRLYRALQDDVVHRLPTPAATSAVSPGGHSGN